ncbi:hypothetical protein [Paenibacillus contaminans]|uniref:Uncharacterized protein n=1 Tax=Paenibacillus contaminans TaxID=450362 RepID=A0A329MQK3_9BACL|nr:hypothetical protein [Paenibacillus contaminans]RAV21033.1 hypothetical protein DQG23_13195 [Paenibacillus contaminans]
MSNGLHEPRSTKRIVRIESVADLREYEGNTDGEVIELVSYYADWLPNSTPPAGGGMFARLTDGERADNGGTIIAVTGSSTRWVRMNVSELDPVEFGAKADGIINDRAAIESTLAALNSDVKVVDFKGRNYYLGTVDLNEQPVFQINSKDGVRLMGMPRMHVTNQLTDYLGYSPIFEFIDCNDIYAECHAVSDSFDPASPHGPVAVQLKSASKSVAGARIIAKVTRGLAALQTVRMTNTKTRRQSADPTWKSIEYSVEADDSEYGVRFISSGDDAHGVIRTNQVSRSYFVVGVSNHTAVVNSLNQRYFMDVLIKAYFDDVTNIHVILNQQSSNGAEWPVSIEHQNDTDDTTIKNITLDLNIIDRINVRAYTREFVCVGRSLTLAGANRATTNCVTDEITIRGHIEQHLHSDLLTLPSITNSGGLIHLDMFSTLNDTQGFTICRGSSRSGKVQGDLTAKPARISLRDLRPDGLEVAVDIFMKADNADLGAANSFRIRENLLLTLADDGSGAVIDVQHVNSRHRGTGAIPTVTYSIHDGELHVLGSEYTRANAEMTVKMEIIGGRVV